MLDVAYSISENDKVLFVGEGNFSLCNDLISWLATQSGDSCDFQKIYASCFEERGSACISEDVEQNLQNKGVRLLFGIDATLLSQYPFLGSERFDKIIFNFPHVGGKMKIQLNRALLKNFFNSAEKILAHNGRISVTLCAGQGGTSEEVKPRRYDDTWKIVEMAADSSLVLRKIKPWPAHLFPNYRPIGFRSTLRAFHTEGALIHEFCRGLPFETVLDGKTIELMDQPVCLEGAQVAPCFHKLNDRSPFKVRDSPQNVLLYRLKEMAPNYTSSTLPIFKGQSLRESLYEVLPPNVVQLTIFYGLVFSKICERFDRPLASCEVLLVGDDAENVVERLSQSIEANMDNCFRRHSDTLWTIYLDELCSRYFKVNVKQLWALGIVVDDSSKIHLPSLCPTRFVHDISFESEGPVSEDRLWYIMHQLPDSIIDSVKPMSIYCPEGSIQVFNCYRIDYISYEKALSKQKVTLYQRNVLGKALECLLNVRVR